MQFGIRRVNPFFDHESVLVTEGKVDSHVGLDPSHKCSLPNLSTTLNSVY